MSRPPIHRIGLILALLLSRGEAKEPADYSHLFAKKVKTILAGLKDTNYQSKTVVDAEKGIFRCNCSGLISYILYQNFPEAYLSVRGQGAPWRVRPLAVTYYETFKSLGREGFYKPAWKQVPKLMDVKPGDIIAWRKQTLTQGLSTGHICMIAAKPILEPDGRIRIRLVDSTSRPHANDTRPKGGRGLGAGDMWFSINKAGAPTGYWLTEKSKHTQTTRIAVGRMVPVTVSAAIEPKAVPATSPAKPSPDKSYLGLSEADAVKLATSRKLDHRTIRRDHQVFPVTKTIIDKRVNFIVQKGKVVRTIRG